MARTKGCRKQMLVDAATETKIFGQNRRYKRWSGAAHIMQHNVGFKAIIRVNKQY